MQMSLPMPKNIFNFKKPKTFDVKSFVNMYREPMVTYSITPNNAPEPMGGGFGRGGGMSSAMKRYRKSKAIMDDFDDTYSDPVRSDALLNMITGMFSKFYAPERIRFKKNGIHIKLNDLVSYKVVFQGGQMKFYLTVPKKWSKNFTHAIKSGWGQVDITKVEEKIVDFNPQKSKAMELTLRHHYALAIKNERDDNDLYPALASLGATLGEDEKLVLDYNIKPVDDGWKSKANKKLQDFKKGKAPTKDEIYTLQGITWRLINFVEVIMDEVLSMLDELTGVKKEEKDKEKKEQSFDLKYSKNKAFQNSRGYDVQIRAVAESNQSRRAKHILKGLESCFNTLDGDNQIAVKYVKTQRGIKAVINAIENDKPRPFKSKDIFYEREMNQLVNMPNRQTLKEYKNIIEQDNFTRTEIHPDFLKSKDDALPFAKTIDKEEKTLHFGGYERDDWTTQGRRVDKKTKLDDRSTATMAFGTQGSGKTSLSIRQALYTFGVHIDNDEEWKKRSKSTVVFDVADGDMLTKIWNAVPEKRRDRVVVLNHSNFNNPIPVNNADLEEFNREVMQDEDYAYNLAEMEKSLVEDVLQTGSSMYMDKWFTLALQIAHTIHPDWGYPEAMRILADDAFRVEEVMPKLEDKRLLVMLKAFNKLADNDKADKIVETIQNRFTQLERDQKLWDCIAQKPLRDENGKVKLNFRKMMDGDEDGAYLILIYIPKSNVSQTYRKFIFAHYFTKIWNVALSREVGFKGREYRPETLVIVDEIHQIIDIPLIARLFIDLFKEPRKYSLRLLLTLHGWSSLAKAGRTYESKIKQSILDNGCNLIMLKGGRDAFESLENFLQPMSVEDYDNLMNLDYCGIFAVRWQNKNHVFQARLLPPADEEKYEIIENGKKVKKLVLPKYDDWDSYMLTKYNSPYGRDKATVRAENLERVEAMLTESILNEAGVEEGQTEGGATWDDLRRDGTKDQ